MQFFEVFRRQSQAPKSAVYVRGCQNSKSVANIKRSPRVSQIAAKAYRHATNVMNEEDDLAELNTSLHTLAAIFPHIQHEVFSEMLSAFNGESRLQIIIEQLLKHQDKYVNGRWRLPAQKHRPESANEPGHGTSIALEDAFRSRNYKEAVKRMLSLEFKSTSQSTIDAVLAERNYCYTLCQPIIQGTAARSWRNHIGALFSRWRKPANDVPESHFMVVWARSEGQAATAEPTLKETGNAELDQELRNTVLAPMIRDLREKQSTKDWHMALGIQVSEAEATGAIYECECCFSDTTFEQLSMCTTSGHVVCFRCLRNAVVEALFGQGWGRNIDHERGQIRCLAPTVGDGCVGCIPEFTVRRAVCQETGGKELWTELEARLASENLRKAQLPLVRCPFCPYAEIDDLYLPSSTFHYGLNFAEPLTTLFLLVLLIDIVPILLLYSLFCRWASFLQLSQPSSLFYASIARLIRSKHLPRRFCCRSPTCGLASCLQCSKAWQDPHVCYESASLSLRKAIEGARTAALKRTCPRCGLGFVKESGCNKLTCVCGYVMCYTCRQGLGGRGNEGYEHFCQHFRPAGGKCAACDKCDLYLGEDEEWREREAMVGVEGIGGNKHQEGLSGWRKNEWTIQKAVDWYVARIITC